MKNQKIQSRLKVKYEEEVVPSLIKEFGLMNKMSVPAVSKVIVNMGLGEAVKNKELIKIASKDLTMITGQKPQVRKAKISVASFSVREGMPIGLKVTLRRDRMYDFLDRFISIVLPRLRDFRGVSRNSFDKSGNYSLGIEEHTVFPEINLADVGKPFGLEVTIVTNTNNVEQSEKLLELMGMPFEKEEEKGK